MPKVKSLIHLLLISILILGCKCKEEEVPTLFLSQESKDYCLYQPGSWWVYQNEQTLEYDTLRLISVKNEILFSKNSNDNRERYSLKLNTNNLLDESTIDLDRGDNESSLILKFNGGVSERIYFDSQPFNKDSVDNVKSSRFSKFNKSIQFKMITYNSVKHFVSLRKLEYGNVYWAKNIGIIQLEKPNGEIWNLVNYSVKQ